VSRDGGGATRTSAGRGGDRGRSSRGERSAGGGAADGAGAGALGMVAAGANAPTRREMATAGMVRRDVFFSGDAASREGVAWRAA